jgi:hypothetical protein
MPQKIRFLNDSTPGLKTITNIKLQGQYYWRFKYSGRSGRVNVLGALRSSETSQIKSRHRCDTYVAAILVSLSQYWQRLGVNHYEFTSSSQRTHRQDGGRGVRAWSGHVLGKLISRHRKYASFHVLLIPSLQCDVNYKAHACTWPDLSVPVKCKYSLVYYWHVYSFSCS